MCRYVYEFVFLDLNETDKGAASQLFDYYTTFVSCFEQIIACGIKKLRTYIFDLILGYTSHQCIYSSFVLLQDCKLK